MGVTLVLGYQIVKANAWSRANVDEKPPKEMKTADTALHPDYEDAATLIVEHLC